MAPILQQPAVPSSNPPTTTTATTTPTTPDQPFVKQGDTLDVFLPSFWNRQVAIAEGESPDFKHPPLPLARIKKVMKSDPDVKMISADAPILFAKACEIFIQELTCRTYLIAESSKRRTLSRTDIARAISKSDQYDFLLDIIPREPDANNPNSAPGSGVKEGESGGGGGSRKGKERDRRAAAMIAAPTGTSSALSLTSNSLLPPGDDNIVSFPGSGVGPVQRPRAQVAATPTTIHGHALHSGHDLHLHHPHRPGPIQIPITTAPAPSLSGAGVIYGQSPQSTIQASTPLSSSSSSQLASPPSAIPTSPYFTRMQVQPPTAAAGGTGVGTGGGIVASAAAAAANTVGINPMTGAGGSMNLVGMSPTGNSNFPRSTSGIVILGQGSGQNMTARSTPSPNNSAEGGSPHITVQSRHASFSLPLHAHVHSQQQHGQGGGQQQMSPAVAAFGSAGPTSPTMSNGGSVQLHPRRTSSPPQHSQVQAQNQAQGPSPRTNLPRRLTYPALAPPPSPLSQSSSSQSMLAPSQMATQGHGHGHGHGHAYPQVPYGPHGGQIRPHTFPVPPPPSSMMSPPQTPLSHHSPHSVPSHVQRARGQSVSGSSPAAGPASGSGAARGGGIRPRTSAEADESNVFFHQIQTYIHGPPPPLGRPHPTPPSAQQPPQPPQR